MDGFAAALAGLDPECGGETLGDYAPEMAAPHGLGAALAGLDFEGDIEMEGDGPPEHGDGEGDDLGVALAALIGDAPQCIPSRGPEKAAWLRKRKAEMASRREKAKLQHQKGSLDDKMATVAMLAPGAARAIGCHVQHPRKGASVSPTHAMAIARLAFGNQAVLHLQRRHTLGQMVEATMAKMCMQRLNGGFALVLSFCKALRESGAQVILGFNSEWDETKMSFKSLAGVLTKSVAQRMSELGSARDLAAQARLRRNFQHSSSEQIMHFSGGISIVAITPEQCHTTDFHWHHPPLSLAHTSCQWIAAALEHMPLSVLRDNECRELATHTDAIVVSTCADKASSNVAYTKLLYSAADSLPSHLYYDAEWCNLHNINNLKVASRDICKLTSKLFSVSTLLKVSGYTNGAVGRIASFVDAKLVRHTGLEAPATIVAENRAFADMYFDLSADRHFRARASGERVPSTFLQNISAVLALDNGDMRSLSAIDHYCFDRETRRPCCRSLQECRDKFIMAYVCLYLGSSWPVPSVSRFTHTQTILAKVCFGFQHHNLFSILVEPFSLSPHEQDVPNILELGGSLSEYQVVHRMRKHVIHSWALDAATKWTCGIFFVLQNPLSKMTYEIFGSSEKPLTLHDLVCDDGVVDATQKAFAKLLVTWKSENVEEWKAVDNMHGVARADCDEEIRRFMRRNLLIFAGGVFRRFEMPLAAPPHSFHRAICDMCSPTADAKEGALRLVTSKRSCCIGAFGRKFKDNFASEEAQRSRLAVEVLRMHERLQKFSTKESEGSHARAQRLLGASRKQVSLAVFARKAFLNLLRASHQKHGGDKKWLNREHQELVQRVEREVEYGREHGGVHLPIHDDLVG